MTLHILAESIIYGYLTTNPCLPILTAVENKDWPCAGLLQKVPEAPCCCNFLWKLNGKEEKLSSLKRVMEKRRGFFSPASWLLQKLPVAASTATYKSPVGKKESTNSVLLVAKMKGSSFLFPRVFARHC